MGPATIVGGTRLLPQALEAMAAASRSLVNMAELNSRAGELVASITGAEAGLISGGAASGITLATAAAIADADPLLMHRLPESDGLRNEVIIHSMHRFGYDQGLPGRRRQAPVRRHRHPLQRMGAGGRN